MQEQNEGEIKKALLAISQDGRVRCPDCLAVAQQFNVKPIVIGRLCNELKLKICGCQLGCFK
ncbi:MAG: hypothetical protein J7M03_03110 [Candidatus Desulfofervidaceae bacterium]|nr:hypothetical protein [Candidatus Desulfofervidaceae bacterium]MDL1971021.1 hypothetical protein [Candidatus Desulfofervidaceae bacterium]